VKVCALAAGNEAKDAPALSELSSQPLFSSERSRSSFPSCLSFPEGFAQDALGWLPLLAQDKRHHCRCIRGSSG
jgi:hypothetical protein